MKDNPYLLFNNEILDRRADLRDHWEVDSCVKKNDELNIIFFEGAPLLSTQNEQSNLAYLFCDHWLLKYANLSIFLGLYKGRQLYAHDLFIKGKGPDNKNTKEYFEEKIQKDPSMVRSYFGNLRTDLTNIPEDDSTLAGTGRALIEWNLNNIHCSRCGLSLILLNYGWEKRCENCNKNYFPRIDPVVIILITSGNKTLLGRSHQFPEKLYSCLAGFIEPGETIEMAAKREIHEEVGLKINNIEFVANQPWPFPSSLMIGLKANTDEQSLNINHKELEDAVWIRKKELQYLLEGKYKHMQAARPGTIARHLLESWVRGTI